ncbi:MAG: hypothetical protein H6670_17920 [Anaerolineaceae bacterium]|nr:hypothetical protein [Anaerolineaceae bacterium]
MNEAYQAAGCGSDRLCCGYDVTEWYLEEMRIHAEWAVRATFDYPIIGGLRAEIYTVFDKFKTYAGQIPYKWMNFVVNGNNSECPSGRECTRSVTMCGKCIDRSELGNLMFGYIGGKLAINQDLLWLAARFAANALKGVAEIATAGIGLYLSTKNITSAQNLCDEIRTSSSNTFAVIPFVQDRVSWDWELANVGQKPDVSKCEPCSEALPSFYPHTRPSGAFHAADGRSVWADNSVIDDQSTSGAFYISQIPGVWQSGEHDYISPELCPDLFPYSGFTPGTEWPSCGTSMER